MRGQIVVLWRAGLSDRRGAHADRDRPHRAVRQPPHPPREERRRREAGMDPWRGRCLEASLPVCSVRPRRTLPHRSTIRGFSVAVVLRVARREQHRLIPLRNRAGAGPGIASSAPAPGKVDPPWGRRRLEGKPRTTLATSSRVWGFVGSGADVGRCRCRAGRRMCISTYRTPPVRDSFQIRP